MRPQSGALERPFAPSSAAPSPPRGSPLPVSPIASPGSVRLRDQLSGLSGGSSMPPARCVVGALTLALLLLLPLRGLAQPPADEEEGPPAPAASQAATTTTVGSLGPDVYLDDITYTLRASYFRTVAI